MFIQLISIFFLFPNVFVQISSYCTLHSITILFVITIPRSRTLVRGFRLEGSTPYGGSETQGSIGYVEICGILGLPCRGYICSVILVFQVAGPCEYD